MGDETAAHDVTTVLRKGRRGLPTGPGDASVRLQYLLESGAEGPALGAARPHRSLDQRWADLRRAVSPRSIGRATIFVVNADYPSGLNKDFPHSRALSRRTNSSAEYRGALSRHLDGSVGISKRIRPEVRLTPQAVRRPDGRSPWAPSIWRRAEIWPLFPPIGARPESVAANRVDARRGRHLRAGALIGAPRRRIQSDLMRHLSLCEPAGVPRRVRTSSSAAPRESQREWERTLYGAYVKEDLPLPQLTIIAACDSRRRLPVDPRDVKNPISWWSADGRQLYQHPAATFSRVRGRGTAAAAIDIASKGIWLYTR